MGLEAGYARRQGCRLANVRFPPLQTLTDRGIAKPTAPEVIAYILSAVAFGENVRWLSAARGSVDALLQHQKNIERSLADFASGWNTEHLSAAEVDLVIQGLNTRLATINEILAIID